jgi:ATP-binding cassette subfamily C exporter for protease/lipase
MGHERSASRRKKLCIPRHPTSKRIVTTPREIFGIPMSGPIADAVQACRRHFMSVMVFSAVLNILQIVPTLYMLQVYDRVIPTHSVLTLAFLTVIMLAALALLAMLDSLRSRLLVRAGVRIDRALAPLIAGAALGADARPEARQAMREFDVLRQVLTGPAILALIDTPWVPIYVLACFLLHPWIGATALAGTILLPLIVWRNEKATGAQVAEAQREASITYAAQDRTLNAAGAVRALGMRPAMVARQVRMRQHMMALHTASSFASGRYASASRFVRLALQSLALGIGALLAIAGEVSVGAVFAAAFLIARALAPIEQLIGSQKMLRQARAGYDTLTRTLDSLAGAAERTILPDPKGALAVEGLTVPRPGSQVPILSDVSFALQPGTVLAIVGPSGAGKSTLLRALAGAQENYTGTIRYDGASQRDWELDRLGAHLGYLPQEPSLLGGTVKENISRFAGELGGDPAAIDAAVIEAAQAAGAHELILRLEGGYDYVVAHGGGNLSSGQAQRLALARALYANPSLLLLDEPNAHLDNEGENQLASAIQRLKESGVTVAIVSHRLSILSVIDKILVIRDGRADLFGDREEILPRITRPGVRPVANKQAS